MLALFDIFRTETGRAVIWLGAGENLDRAKGVHSAHKPDHRKQAVRFDVLSTTSSFKMISFDSVLHNLLDAWVGQ